MIERYLTHAFIGRGSVLESRKRIRLLVTWSPWGIQIARHGGGPLIIQVGPRFAATLDNSRPTG